MLFNSLEFFAFWTVFLAIFFGLPRRCQPFVLVIASYVFYMGWKPWFSLLLLLTTCVDFCTALLMEKARSQAGRRAAMLTALTVNLGILAAVKYFDFVAGNLADAAHAIGYSVPRFGLDLILPVGISFYTFQSVGYTLDVYFRRVPAERNFLTYAQYVAFFPQLVAGPIERAAHMLPQFRVSHRLEWRNVKPGLWLILYGLFKKMCVADPVSPIVAAIYGNPSAYGGAYHLVATILFALQIYCDFSGYSDIARGVARVMGFDLMVNFAQPYFRGSLTRFWRCWHISLSSWFRDYLYIPLGGSRGSRTSVERNLMIVFVVSGFWHGASWNFILWGALHGLGLVIERLASRWRWLTALRLGFAGPLLGWLWTASLVLTGWVFFRARTLHDALTILGSLGHLGHLSYFPFKLLHFTSFDIIAYLLCVATLLLVDYHLAFGRERLARLQRLRLVPSAAALGLAYAVIMFGVFGRVDFIYFQF